MDYLQRIHLPIESALTVFNCTIAALILAGAQISVPTNQGNIYSNYDNGARASIVDWVQAQISILEKENERLSNEEAPYKAPSYPSNPKTWEEHCLHIVGKLIDFREAKRETPTAVSTDAQKKRCDRTLAYYKEVLKLLRDNWAKTYFEIYPERLDKENPPSGYIPRLNTVVVPETIARQQYRLIRGRDYRNDVVQPHLLDSYDALFQACWEGDNTRIEELCLPPKANPDKQPIQITVFSVARTFIGGDRNRNLRQDGIHTPLSIAILARRWTTARLIMTITALQYSKEEAENTWRPISTGVIDLRKHIVLFEHHNP